MIRSADPVIMYLIVRQTTPLMSVGKIAAQVGHAVQMVTEKFWEHWDEIERIDNGDQVEQTLTNSEVIAFREWYSSDYTKIVLTANDKEWSKLKTNFKEPQISIVIDNGYTELSPQTETVMGFIPMLKSQAPKIIKHLQLLK